MHLRALAATLALLALARPAAAQPDPLRARFTARLEATGGGAPRTAYRRMWEVMDSVVLRELSRGGTADEVNRTLSAFPGFAGAAEGAGFTTDQAAFYDELPRALPGYVVFPVRASGEALLLGVYNFGVNGAGRVSLFARRGGEWTRTGVADARFAVTPFLLPLADSALALVTLDVFTGADHQDGQVRVWRIGDGGLELLRTLPGELKEPSGHFEDGAVRISFSRVPRHLDAPVLGTRIEHVAAIAPSGATVAVRDSIANPWVEIADRYYALAARNPAAARALLASPALAARLGTRIPRSLRDAGRPDVGGWIVIGLHGREYMVNSTRGADGRWRIVSILPGEGVPCAHAEEPPPPFRVPPPPPPPPAP
jgi:hypothetical protein